MVNGAPPSWRQAVRAVLLSCGEHVSASHSTSLRVLGGPTEFETDLMSDGHADDDMSALARVIRRRSGLPD